MISNTELTKPQKIKKLKKPWTKKKKIIVICSISGGVVLIATALLLYFLVFAVGPTEDSPKQPEPVHYYSQLTGVETSEANTKRPITAVMIENSPEARPQSGLDADNVVFEAVAEGGITRFVMLYQEAQPELIGPVRSVRAYYLEWATGFDSAIAHVGGSDEAQSMLQTGRYALDLDQFYNADYYWRSSERYAPHNMYTSAESLNNLLSSKGKISSSFEAWPRQDGKYQAKLDENGQEIVPEQAITQIINMPVSTGQFAVQYQYDHTQNKYLRYQGGLAHMDTNGQQIAPDVAIAIMVNFSATGDAKAHNEISTVGNGTAYIFQNGTVTEAKWRKDSAKENIRFLNADGEEVALNRGQTWITAVANDETVTWN
jgi:hypothetical protein